MHTTTTKGASEMTDGDQVITTRKRVERGVPRSARQAQLDREPSGAEASSGWPGEAISAAPRTRTRTSAPEGRRWRRREPPDDEGACTARDAYMEHHRRTVEGLEQITTAVTNHDVPGADPESVNWRRRPGALTEHREIADQMFNEGEYAA